VYLFFPWKGEKMGEGREWEEEKGKGNAIRDMQKTV
jgi:hypothetical protein